MNKTITSKNMILLASKEIVKESGLSSLGIRDVAKKCDISIGSVYNYFSSKEDLVLSTIESIWTEILNLESWFNSNLRFDEVVICFYNSVIEGSKEYSFFLDSHAISIMNTSKAKGKNLMNNFFENIINLMVTSIKDDKCVKPDVFSKDFTEEDFAEFVFSNILMLVMKRKTSCDFLVKMIQKTIY